MLRLAPELVPPYCPRPLTEVQNWGLSSIARGVPGLLEQTLRGGREHYADSDLHRKPWLETSWESSITGTRNEGPVAIYKKTRLRTPSTDHSSRIPYIVRNARVQPTASSAAIQAQVEPSLGTLCLLEPYEGAWLKDIWDLGARENWTAAEWNQVVFSDESRFNLSSNDNRVFVCEDPMVNVSILPLLYGDAPLPQLV
ncbi:transposable element Tcb2 transposase [Trichonephila clavipes]|nr:transposable element Tcb2 transposase [Trichonephila clavipes]